MKRFCKFTPWATTALIALSSCLVLPARGQSEDNLVNVKAPEGQILFEMVGQVINSTPTTSTQFGYLTFIRGIDQLFTGTPENETTASFTFYRETSNLRVNTTGPLRTISREGTTTVFLNATPSGNFANPDSFRDGTAIQTSVLRQQVVVDTVTGMFTVVNEETVTSTSAFALNGTNYRIGAVGDVFRTVKTGHLNTPGSPPTGWFAGYSVSAGKNHQADNSNSTEAK
jgi:hypothetical protein